MIAPRRCWRCGGISRSRIGTFSGAGAYPVRWRYHTISPWQCLSNCARAESFQHFFRRYFHSLRHPASLAIPAAPAADAPKPVGAAYMAARAARSIRCRPAVPAPTVGARIARPPAGDFHRACGEQTRLRRVRADEGIGPYGAQSHRIPARIRTRQGRP